MKYFSIFILFFSLAAQSASLNLATGPFDSGQIFVPCEFDGSQQDCMIDTGSTRTFIKKDEFSMNYPSKSVVEHGGASGATVKCDLVEIEHFLLEPDFYLNKMEAARCPVGKESDMVISRSVIGLNVFGTEIVYFDFANRNLSTVLEIPQGLSKYQIQREPREHLSIQMDSAGIETYGVWDTGAGLTSIDEEFVKNHPDNFEYIEDIWGKDGIGDPVQMKLYNSKKLTIGTHNFYDIHVIAFDFSPIRPYFNKNVDFIIGYNIITQANWFFDFDNYQWTVE